MLLLPFVPLTLAAALIAARALPDAPRLERACATAVLLPGLAIGLVHALGAVHLIARGPWFLACAGLALAARLLGGRAAWQRVRDDARAGASAAASLRRDPAALAALLTAALAVGLAALSTWMLEPWAWDAVGYHLPIVHDALQTGTLREVPTSVIYVNCYPRLIDVFFIAWRLSLETDAWIELGQLPFGIGAAVAIATLAARAGVPAPRAVAFASLWLAVPTVMLELATNYVDVAVGALTLMAFTLATGPLRHGAPLVAGLAAGLLLGSKPSAPPIAGLVMAVLAVRAIASRALPGGALGIALGLGVGVWKYVENIARWGNPIWPAHARFGPITLPGKVFMGELASSGLREPYRSMGWARRILASWTLWPEAWVYDMRIGGFGPLFTFGLLPLVAVVLAAAVRSPGVRDRLRPVALPAALLTAAALASPGAFWARYTCAVPGAWLAVSMAAALGAPRWARRLGEGLFVGLALLGIAVCWRGFTTGGPSLLEIAAMPQEARATAYALDDQEADWQAARGRLRPGEAFGYDWSYGLPGRLWNPDGRSRVVFLSTPAPPLDALLAWSSRERVRLMALGEGPTGDADLARAHPEHFRELFRSHYPEWQPCAVFERISPMR